MVGFALLSLCCDETNEGTGMAEPLRWRLKGGIQRQIASFFFISCAYLELEIYLVVQVRFKL
jgi:hypothetical protein